MVEAILRHPKVSDQETERARTRSRAQVATPDKAGRRGHREKREKGQIQVERKLA